MAMQSGENLPRVKISNQVAIRKMIHHYGPITRVEVARNLNLTLPTITTYVNTMMKEGILQEVALPVTADKTMGRPAIPVDYVSDCAFFIGVEMRGSRRQLVITDIRGNVVYEDASETPCEDYHIALHSACSMIQKVLHSGVVPVEKIARIGFCTPGIVDSAKGMLVVHPGYGWHDKSLSQDLARLTGYRGPIIIENNARARATASVLFHPRPERLYGSLAYMFISSGIACPFILNNGVVDNTALGAGEVGHMVLNPDGPMCTCGNHGCLEAFASDTAVIDRCVAAMGAGEAPVLASICRNEVPTMQQILQAQDAGDKAVTEIVNQALYYIGLAIANIYNFIRPDILVAEGHLFSNIKNRQTMLDTINANLYSTIKDANFVFVAPDSRSGALGAAAVAIRDYLEDVY